MPEYEIYTVDLAKVQIARTSVRAADDDHAIDTAREIMKDGPRAEVWEGTRFVMDVRRDN